MTLIDDGLTVKNHMFMFGQQADGISLFGAILRFIKIEIRFRIEMVPHC